MGLECVLLIVGSAALQIAALGLVAWALWRDPWVGLTGRHTPAASPSALQKSTVSPASEAAIVD